MVKRHTGWVRHDGEMEKVCVFFCAKEREFCFNVTVNGKGKKLRSEQIKIYFNNVSSKQTEWKKLKRANKRKLLCF